ncbi:hypothetical protein IscW_ISCW012636 [Ixodes scapularis]|uniref:Uncharacterized protein n=1 Tax=Ixodes scapularis TaxID=6945 RepID=B7QCS9_IXOSC|nr:hypothetical protein IscW_ISCW012636 [Ixodes scapularis]|eukprot:XP_002413343.1 hypothetical protein IscW_ISCW012636 [Ixodes scapularis]
MYAPQGTARPALLQTTSRAEMGPVERAATPHQLNQLSLPPPLTLPRSNFSTYVFFVYLNGEQATTVSFRFHFIY